VALLQLNFKPGDLSERFRVLEGLLPIGAARLRAGGSCTRTGTGTTHAASRNTAGHFVDGRLGTSNASASHKPGAQTPVGPAMCVPAVCAKRPQLLGRAPTTIAASLFGLSALIGTSLEQAAVMLAGG
jgi:hypothetical protein